MTSLEMKNYVMISTEKQQIYHKYLTGEEILNSNQRIVREQAKFTYSLLSKAFVKQTIEVQGKNEAEALEVLKCNTPQKSNNQRRDS